MSLAVTGQKTPNDACVAVSSPVTDVNTVVQFPKFDFLVSLQRGVVREGPLYWLVSALIDDVVSGVVSFGIAFIDGIGIVNGIGISLYRCQYWYRLVSAFC